MLHALQENETIHRKIDPRSLVFDKDGTMKMTNFSHVSVDRDHDKTKTKTRGADEGDEYVWF